MSSTAVLKTEAQPIRACTVSRDVQIFDLLIEDMEATLGESWGDLGFGDALAFLEQPEAESLQFICIALDEQDEADLGLIVDIIAAARTRGIKVIIVAEDVSPASLHQLLREGGNEFVPYPLPENELAQAIDRVLAPPAAPAPVAAAPDPRRPSIRAEGDRNGVVLPVHGNGRRHRGPRPSSPSNLAWDWPCLDPNSPPARLPSKTISTCSWLGLDLYLDSGRRSDGGVRAGCPGHRRSMDWRQLHPGSVIPTRQASCFSTAPTELVPLDLLSSDTFTAGLYQRGAAPYFGLHRSSTCPIQPLVDGHHLAALEAAHVYLR